MSAWALGIRLQRGWLVYNTFDDTYPAALATYWNWDDTKTNMENVDGNLSPVYIPT